MTYPSELDDIRMEEIERRLKTAEHRLLAFPWKDWPPDRVKDLVEDLRALVDHIQRRLRPCLSTHGGAGYAVGSHWRDGKVVCGACGMEIENPPPTGRRWIREKGWRGWLLGRGRWEPTWPAFVAPEDP